MTQPGIGGRPSGAPRPAHAPGSSGKSGEPPNLAKYSTSPRYDLATVVQLVGVRPMILWGWEQNLGIPAPTRVNDDVGSPVRRYSERDLVASLWLRDQILDGVSPPDAATKLRAALRPVTDEDETWEASDAGLRLGGHVNTGPLPDSFVPQRSPKVTRQLSDLDRSLVSGLGAAEQVDPRRASYASGLDPASSGSYGVPPSRSQVWVSPLSGPLGGRISRSNPDVSAVSGPLTPPAVGAPPTGRLGPMSGPITSGPLPPPPVLPGMQWSGESTVRSGAAWAGVSGAAVPNVAIATSTHGREVRTLIPQLLRAFASFDTLGANHIVREALSVRSVENVCVMLLQPTLARVSDQWASHRVTVPEERFATNYVRGLLFSFLNGTQERVEAPLVLVACGPREMNDVHALVLAVVLRRAGLRVIYLGQDEPRADIVEEARACRPAMVALSVAAPQRVRSLLRVAKAIGQFDAPAPTFVFSGPIFVRNPELQNKLNGYGRYLGDDMRNATYHAMNLLGLDTSSRR